MQRIGTSAVLGADSCSLAFVLAPGQRRRITLISGPAITVNHVAVQASAAAAPRGRCCYRPLTAGFRPAVAR